MSCKKFFAVLSLITSLVTPVSSNGQQNCPAVDSVKKWEVISSYKLLAYDKNDEYYFFLELPFAINLKVGGPVTLRFFSSTICKSDNIVVNGQATRVGSLEGIRR